MRPASRAEPLADGLQVGEDLARVELVGERVDHRDRGRRGHRGHPGLREGPPHHGVDVAGQHPRGVLDGLLAAELHGAAVDHDRRGRRAGRCRPRTTAGCAWSSSRRSSRPTFPRGRGSPSRSAFIRSARSSTSACSAGDRSSSRRKCRTIRPPSRCRGSAGQCGEEAGDVVGGHDQWRGQPDRVGRDVVDQVAGVAAAVATAGATGAASPMPSSSPVPRTSVTSGWPSASTPAAISLPSAAACSHRPSAAIVRSTARPAAQATGLPPNVVPCWPGRSRSPAAPTPMHAPSGRPPPSPLASVITSGVMPACWKANQLPSRPTPVCTSSSTSSAPAFGW